MLRRSCERKIIYGSQDRRIFPPAAGTGVAGDLSAHRRGRVVGTALMSRMDARRVLSWYCMASVALVALAFATGGLTGIVCIMLTYFCQSIMFPTIFALATKGLAPSESKLASSLVIMAIVGGAVMPPLAGLLSSSGGMKMALLVPFAGFSYIVWYVLRGAKAE